MQPPNVKNHKNKNKKAVKEYKANLERKVFFFIFNLKVNPKVSAKRN